MRTTPHAHPTERISLPRRLVPRRRLPTQPDCVLDVLQQINNPPAERFYTGDVLTIKGTDGWKRIITLLGVHECGFVDGMIYDGLPHYLGLCDESLEGLRVIEIGHMDMAHVAMYRDWLELPPLDLELQAVTQ